MVLIVLFEQIEIRLQCVYLNLILTLSVNTQLHGVIIPGPSSGFLKRDVRANTLSRAYLG